MKHNQIFAGILFGLFVLGLTGCSNPDSKYTKVEGTITYNGAPVDGATVTFMAVAADGESAAGSTNASGRYTLSSSGGVVGGAGVLPGEYIVRVSKREQLPPDPDQEAYNQGKITLDELQQKMSTKVLPIPKELLPEKYGQPSTTNLKATVNKGGVSKQDFDLKD
jgi:hypothetical protein